MRTKRMVSVAVALVASAAGLVVGAPAAQAAPCDGTYTIVVGGFDDPGATIFHGGVDQRVGYSAQLSSQSVREGVNELNRSIRDQRAACPAQHAR